MNKDDLLSMVRYGAERVFSSEATNITEEDVDALIAKVRGVGQSARGSATGGECPSSQSSVLSFLPDLLHLRTLRATGPLHYHHFHVHPSIPFLSSLLLQGEAATKELNDKLTNFSNDAMRFTMDGGISGG